MNFITKDKITNGCKELFLKYGVKSISIDDLCNHLRILKRTFYLHFRNKDEVVKEVTNSLLMSRREKIAVILNKPLSALEKLHGVFEEILFQFKNYHPKLMYDLRKYNPEAFKILLEYKKDELDTAISALLDEGKESGLIEKHTDTNVFITSIFWHINAFSDNFMTTRESITIDSLKKIILMDLIGISTLEGHKILLGKM